MLTVWPTTAYAADLNTEVTGLVASSDDNGTWACSNGVITGSVTANVESGCYSDSYTAKSTTLTLTNQSGASAFLSYALEKSLGGQNSRVVDNGNQGIALRDGQSTTIVLTSDDSSDKVTKVVIRNISLTLDHEVTTTFVPSNNGSFAVNNGILVDGNSITLTRSSGEAYKLNATAESGYKFSRWYNTLTGDTISTSNPATIYSLDDQSISAEFVDANTAVFQVGTSQFVDLNEAVAYAQQKNESKITLIDSGILPSGNYNIPFGKTLLIPFDDNNTLFTTAPDVVYGSHVNPTAYKTLTMADGASITIENGGAISLSSRISSTGQLDGWNGTPTGPDGRIIMESGSTITVNNGGNLYAYGYITGHGSVTAKSGSHVYECFQIKDWRGGTATSNVYSYAFIISQYYVQNIEVPLTLEAGATETGFSAANAGGSAYTMSADFIGAKGLFNLTNGSATKRYDAKTDRLIVDLNGEASLSSMTMSGLPAVGSITTSEYELPINSNITINCNSGTKVTVSQDIKMLPSSVLNIREGATATIASGKKVYLYDNDDWGNFTGNARLYTVGYSAANGTTAKRTAKDLVDAQVIVDGTLNVNGDLFTSVGGADIKSNGSGKIVYGKDTTENSPIYEMANNKTKTEVSMTAAKLHNATSYSGDKYYDTKGVTKGTVIPYSRNHWGKDESTSVTVTFDKNAKDATGTMENLEGSAGTELTLTTNGFQREGYTFTGWTTNADGTGDSFENEAKATFDEDVTLYAKWEINKYTIKFVNDDDSELQSVTVNHGEMPEYTGETPVKQATAQYTYTFDGWTPEIVAATGDATYTAKYTSTTNKYTVKFLGEDGTELKSEEMEYGTSIEAPETPSKQNTDQYSYVFDGWYNGDVKLGENDVVTGDVTYQAKFTEEVNTYTVTWNIEGDKTEQTYEYGAIPVYSGKEPTKEGGEEFTYTFAGWSPEITTVTGDVEYFAQFIKVKNSYTITFKNEDGTVLQSTEVEYGETPTFNGDTPTKASTDQYTYTFDKWTPEVTAVTGEAEYTATYTKTVNEYTITWLNDDGTQIDTTTVAYGEVPTHADAVKDPDAQYTYTFDKWTPEVVSVTGDAAYTATYTQVVNKYKVNWVNEDDTLLKTEEVEYGVTPVYEDDAHRLPDKPATDESVYEFAGWSPAVGEVTGDVTYKATYSESDKLYNVIWVDDVIDPDTQKPMVLKTAEDVSYDNIPAYEDADHKTPSKEADAQFSYTFKEWTRTLDKETSTYILTAVYDKTVNTYTVSWLNYDGTVLEIDENVPYGEMPVFSGANPTRGADAQYNYSFKGWDKAIEAVAGDVTYTAEYGMALNTYTITFVDSDNTVLLTRTLEYGAMPEYTGENPTKAETFNARYDFTGWTPTIETVTSDATYKVQFSEVLKNGWTQWEGNTYFMIDGAPVKGLYTTESQDGSHEGTFAFDPKTGVFLSGLNGVNEFEGEIYFFKAGEVQKNKGLTRVIKDGQILYYYFQEDGKAVRSVPEGGQDFWVEKTNGLNLPKWGYYFNEDGTIVHNEDTSLYGIHPDENGVLCYYIDGVKAHMGMIKVDGDYYYVRGSGELVVGCSYWCTDVNSTGLEEGTYAFDGQGRMVVEEPDDRTGIFEEDGSLWYYEHGRRTYAGLIEVDGSYYYVRTSGEVVHGQRYWTTKTNGLMPEASYEFDEDGRMVTSQAEPKNGFYEEDGSLWYYVDGAKSYAGLIEVDGSYYYVRTSGEAVRGRSYWISKTNDLMTEGSYTFDEDGRMVVPQEPDPSEAKQGIVSEDGSLWWYVDGKRTYAGVFELDGSYYYAKTNGEVVHGRRYWISKTNGLLPEASYEFAEDGKMAV
jgi:uncharacterized repeat protein (TIGR02543 family)